MEKKYYELTAPQKSIWLTEQYYKNTNINNVCGTFYSDEILDFKIFKKALNTFLQSNDSFRIKLHFTEDKIVQYFSELKDIDFEIIDIKDKNEQSALEEKMASKVFTMLDSLLFEIVLFRYPDNHGGFVINSHHIISDSWTNGIVANDVALIYSKIKKNELYEKDKSLSYIEYINSEKQYIESNKFQKDKEYWNNLFTTIPEVATIPSTKNAEKEDNIAANRILLDINAGLFSKLKSFCTENKVSLYNFFMAIFALYLGRVSNLDEFVIGTPILNRTNYKEKETTGMFINTLPLKITLSHEKTFLENLKDIAINSMSLLRHQKYSFQYLIEDLRKKEPNLPKLYNVLYSYQITKMNDNLDSLNHVTSWAFNKTIADDLDIHMFEWNENDSIQIAYDYRISKYNEQDISDLHARILHMINQILENNNILLKDIEIVTPEEKHKILFDFNNTHVDYPKDKTIVDLFEEQVEKTPDNIAVVFEDQKLTYKELNEKANQLARYLVEKGVKKGNIIGLFLNKSLEVIIAMFAILKSGAAFLPLDTEYPDERLNYILSNSSCKFILKSNKINNDIICNYNNINIDLDNSNIYSKDNTNISLHLSVDDVMYVMYTSGSTGKPKGVMVKHKNIIRLAKYPNFLSFENNENMVQTGTIVFDACIFEIFGALLNGFKTYILEKNKLLNINYFSEFLKNNDISTLFLTTGLFNEFGMQSPKMFSHLKNLLTGGDVISASSVRNIKNSCPNINIINCYGPTENGSYSTCYKIDNNNSHIPIGKPITNSTAYIVSNSGSLCPIGVPGELWVGGDGVAKGYLNNPELTKEKFINNPFGSGTIYKTGDLVKWLPDGNIEFIGRIDNQIKLRGFRIELSEIDNNILTYPNVKQSISIIQNINNNKTICSYIVSDEPVNIINLKKYLSKTLANYMIPTHIITLEKLPLNINGKVDRKLLPLPELDSENINIITPRNEIDNTIILCLKEILGLSSISITSSFFDIGGDSLSAISLATKLTSLLKQAITVQDIFNNPIIMDLSDYIFNLKNSSIKIISKHDKRHLYPLSASQDGIYYAANLDINSISYNTAGGIITDKTLDISKLEKCFNILIKRHDALRTHFNLIDGKIVQIVDDNIDFNLKIEELSNENTDKIYKDFVKPFDLSRAPLFRAKAVNLSNGQMLLLLDMHHIISDGISLKIFMQELCSLYNEETLPSKNIDYTDFCIWEEEQFKTEEFNKKKEFWVNKFKKEIPLLNMPTTYPRPSMQSFEGKDFRVNLSKEMFNKILSVAKTLNITPYMLMLSCYYILLYKYTAQDDIVVGSPIVGRELPELSNVLGMFVNTLALRNNVDHNLSFEEFSKNIKESCLEYFKNQSYPFDMLVKDLKIKRDPSRNPLFDTVFVYQNEGYPQLNINGINAKYYIPKTTTSKFDLTLEVVPNDGEYLLRFEYCTKLFNEDFIKRFSSHYTNILNIILKNNNIKIADIDMLSEGERDQILYQFNDTKIDYPKNKTIIELFEEQVQKVPNNIAVVFEGQQLTYKELNEKANQLARFLINNNISSGSNLAILLPRSINTIVSMLATLKIGASYMLIDTSLPSGRIEYMLTNSNSCALITDKKTNVTFKNTIYLEDFSPKLYHGENLNISSNASDIFTLLYTSGSTGTPKGIMLHNAGMINVVLAHKLYMNIDACNNFLSYSSVSFDMFQVETYVPLLNGKKIILASEEEKNTPTAICNLIKTYEINFILSTPLKLKLVLDCCDTFLSSLSVIQLGGEILTSNIVQQINNVSSATIYNAYGPSEITACCTVKEVTNKNNINIGKPICNTKILILNKDFGLCPIGVPGELCICGVGVSYGYINNKNLTNSSFVSNKYFNNICYRSGDIAYLDNNLDINYIGRSDKQIKLRGLRIELSEIETNILSFDNIDNCCVICKDNEYLSAFIVSKHNINTKELKNYLKNYLPLYMIPKYITQINSIPMNSNGKADKIKLQSYNENIFEDRTIVEYKNNKEKTCCKIWSELLKTEVSPLDDVFELGADSLLAIKFKTKMLSNNINISYSNIFKYPIIRDFCSETFFSKEKDIDNYNYSKINKVLENNNIRNLHNITQNKNNNILLLGANGFVGMHIIDSFIKKDKGNIYCIVRDKNKESANQRFIDTLHFYFGSKLDKYINKRIFILKGNILKEDFELSKTNINMLSKNIDIVINAAALVKHYGKESLFNETNIGSTKIAIQFCKSFKKRFIYISSLSVSGNDVLHNNTSFNPLSEDMYFSETNLYIGQKLDNVYIKSKFEAEKLVLENIASNSLDAQILRLGNITSRLSDGKFQINPNENAFANKLRSLIMLKYIPETLISSYIEFTPVDICSDAIILIIQNYISDFSVFHIYDNNHVYVKDFIRIINDLNIDCSIINENDFSNLIKEKTSANINVLDGIINDLTEDNKLYYTSNIHILSEFSRAYLYHLGFIWPKIDEKYIKKYIKYLYKINFFKEE